MLAECEDADGKEGERCLRAWVGDVKVRVQGLKPLQRSASSNEMDLSSTTRRAVTQVHVTFSACPVVMSVPAILLIASHSFDAYGNDSEVRARVDQAFLMETLSIISFERNSSVVLLTSFFHVALTILIATTIQRLPPSDNRESR